MSRSALAVLTGADWAPYVKKHSRLKIYEGITLYEGTTDRIRVRLTVNDVENGLFISKNNVTSNTRPAKGWNGICNPFGSRAILVLSAICSLQTWYVLSILISFSRVDALI